jgi:hypothetical protein
MKTSKLTIALASFALAISSSSAFIACSSDDSSQPGPSGHDASTSDSQTTDSNNTDSNMNPDTADLDTGSCMSDAATCNSCYTAQQAAADPYNACSSATANCVPFNNATRVPANVPPVP